MVFDKEDDGEIDHKDKKLEVGSVEGGCAALTDRSEKKCRSAKLKELSLFVSACNPAVRCKFVEAIVNVLDFRGHYDLTNTLIS